jgi:hypothetical protein
MQKIKYSISNTEILQEDIFVSKYVLLTPYIRLEPKSTDCNKSLKQ